MISALVAARKAVGLTQRDLAAKLKLADPLDMKAGPLLTSALSSLRGD